MKKPMHKVVLERLESHVRAYVHLCDWEGWTYMQATSLVALISEDVVILQHSELDHEQATEVRGVVSQLYVLCDEVVFDLRHQLNRLTASLPDQPSKS